MLNQPKAYLLASLSVIFWSTIAVAFKVSLRSLDPFQIVFMASLISLVIFFVINIFTEGFAGMSGQITPKAIAKSAFLGFLNPFLYYIILIHAYSMITAQEAMTLNYIWPIMLALLAVPMLGQKLRWLSLLAMVISFGGIIVIATKGDIASLSPTNILGCSLAAGSSVVWALYWIFNLKDKRTVSGKLMLNFFFGTLYSVIAITLFSTFRTDGLMAWTGGVYLGFFEMGITFMLWLSALKLSKKTYLVSQFIFISPPLSLMWIWLILKEPIIPSTITGLVMIIAGIVLQQRTERTKLNR